MKDQVWFGHPPPKDRVWLNPKLANDLKAMNFCLELLAHTHPQTDEIFQFYWGSYTPPSEIIRAYSLRHLQELMEIIVAWNYCHCKKGVVFITSRSDLINRLNRGTLLCDKCIKLKFSPSAILERHPGWGRRSEENPTDCASAKIEIPKEDDPSSPTSEMIRDFYESWEWSRLAYDSKKQMGRRCALCGKTPEHGVAIHSDHIKPIRHHWHLRLDPSNIQILCVECNRGKGSRDETDWRAANDENADE
jgi:hypothetical protein